jgi:hypothetical protein
MRSRGDFGRIYTFTSSTNDIPDEKEACLVILGPEHPHASKDAASTARESSHRILEARGSSPRIYRNSLVFLAADRTRLRDLEQAIRLYLAWKSIDEEKVTLNLDAFQANQAKTKRETWNETVEARIPETFQWLLVPGQPDKNGPVEWQEIRLQGTDTLAGRASKKLKNEELLVTRLAGVRLRHEMDKVPLWRGDNVPLKQLAEDFAQYLYLPRLRDSEVLIEAAKDGVSLLTWNPETFAYADGWDEKKERYLGLRSAQGITVSLEGKALLIRPDVAARQIEADKALVETVTTGTGTIGNGGATGTYTGGETTTTEEAKHIPVRFYGSVELDATRLGRDAGKIAEEVIQHLSALMNSKVELTLEIKADVPEGVPDNVVRTVTENCRTLKFKSHGFEEK